MAHVLAAVVLACSTFACPWTAEQGLHWAPSPDADGYRLYVSHPGTPVVLWLDKLPCCSVYPAKHLRDAAFPIEPGELGQLIFYVSAYNTLGESEMSLPVGIVSDQRIVLFGGES